MDRINVVVSGKIVDETTGKPIEYAEVAVVCWYKDRPFDQSYKIDTLRTDENGKFKTRFSKGNKIEIAAKYTGYNPRRSDQKLEGRQLKINMSLSRIIPNPRLVYYSHSTWDSANSSSNTFLRVETYRMSSNDSANTEFKRSYGYDFSSQKTSSDTNNCDIWFAPELNADGEPKKLRAHVNGGIVPVHETKGINSFLYQAGFAPEKGYVSEYTLAVDELGCFVLCRDGKTYGKIVFDRSVINVSMDNFSGKYFISLYQPDGSRNLSYGDSDIDLEQFLIGPDIRH